MSSSGWGGPGDGSQGGPWQGGGPQHGAPQHGAPQHGAPPHGAPPHWTSPHGAPPPVGPQGSGSQQPPRRRPWALIAVALTCVTALLLVVGGGVAFLLLRQGGDAPAATGAPSESTSTEPSESPSETPSETPTASESKDFTVVAPYDPPTGTADELWEVMATNPLTEGTLPAVAECELPATPIDPSTEELQAVLDAAANCLNRVWSTASSDRGLPWTSPKVVVYEHPDVPASAVCDSNFSADFPRMCNLDGTLYWPIGYGIANELSDPADVPGAYLWDLSYVYTNPVAWNSSLAVYYQSLRDELETSDEARHAQAWQAFVMQRECLASAAAMQVPSAAEPSAELRDKLTDPGTWEAGEPPESVSPETRAAWIERGFDSGGDLARCNTWVADADQVS